MLFFRVCLCLCVVLLFVMFVFLFILYLLVASIFFFGGGQLPPHRHPCRFGRGPWGCAAASFRQDILAVQRAVLRYFRHHAEVDRVGLDWRRFFYARPGELLFQRRRRDQEQRLPCMHSNSNGNSHGNSDSTSTATSTRATRQRQQHAGATACRGNGSIHDQARCKLAHQDSESGNDDAPPEETSSEEDAAGHYDESSEGDEEEEEEPAPSKAPAPAGAKAPQAKHAVALGAAAARSYPGAPGAARPAGPRTPKAAPPIFDPLAEEETAARAQFVEVPRGTNQQGPAPHTQVHRAGAGGSFLARLCHAH